MSSSEDDVPLGRRQGANGTQASNKFKSSEKISKTTDIAMSTGNTNGRVEPSLSLVNGPVRNDEDEMDIDKPTTNGTLNKRKSRGSTGGGVPNYKDASDSEDAPLNKRRKANSRQIIESDSDDVPLVASKSNGSISKSQKPPGIRETSIGEADDSDVPLEKKLVAQKIKIEKRAEQQEKELKAKDQKASNNKSRVKDDSDDEPIVRKRQSNGVKPNAKATAKKITKPKDESDSDKPLVKKPGKSSKTAITPAKANKNSTRKTQEDDEAEAEEEEYELPWANSDGSKKWTTLSHAGVVFPPPYEPLPKNVKLKYDGKAVSLHPDAEEVAGFFGAMLNSAHNVENPTFQKNFFSDFKAILKKTGGAKDKDGNKVEIKDFAKLDFQAIFNYYFEERERKKALPATEKKAIKTAKDAAEADFIYCMWDNKKQKVGNFRVEPPGLFRGRGDHPKTGHVKTRVQPEQITINIGKEAKVPQPPAGHKWKEVKHDNTGTWLAMWQENINGNYKYVMLAANSDVKGQSDYNKFEKARELKKHIATIRREYKKDMKSELMADRQRATAVYLIDQLALRAGNEKGEDEADTVGCCSLKYEHVTLRPPNILILDFLGKDSIRFYNEVAVDQQVFKNLRIFKKGKSDGDEIFDRLQTSSLNKHLSSYMPGLTAKVFRTYNASFTMSNLLRDMKSEGSLPEKVKDYNDANREVAILCNHKRTVTAGHAGQMEKLEDKIKGLIYQKWRLKQMLIDLEPKLKKKRGEEFFELPEELDTNWIEEHQKAMVEETRQKIEKKFAKENEKLVAEKQKPMKDKELKERLQDADELAAKYKKENKSKKVLAEGKGVTVEKIDANIDKIDQRIATMKLQAEDKESNKEVALGTSKINYIDPRLTVVFSKKFNVPIERFFSKTLREKFEWAIKSVDENWEF